ELVVIKQRGILADLLGDFAMAVEKLVEVREFLSRDIAVLLRPVVLWAWGGRGLCPCQCAGQEKHGKTGKNRPLFELRSNRCHSQSSSRGNFALGLWCNQRAGRAKKMRNFPRLRKLRRCKRKGIRKKRVEILHLRESFAMQEIPYKKICARGIWKFMEFGAVEWIRPTTVLLPPAPQAGASASSATTAQRCVNFIVAAPRKSGKACRARFLPAPILSGKRAALAFPSVRVSPGSQAHSTAVPPGPVLTIAAQSIAAS